MVRSAASVSRLLLLALLVLGGAGWTAPPLVAGVADAAPSATQDAGGQEAGGQEAIQGVTGPDRTLSVEEPFGIRLLRGMLGMGFLIFMAWLFTAKRKAVSWSLVAKGLGLQIVFALLVLR
ncbi:MAG: Na+ dependent nucleoside transporter N-terminal domain-containing protein, partial [Myxococcota bacterium]